MTDHEATARTIISNDWDERGTVSAHLPVEIAKSILSGRGWTRENEFSEWVSPSGFRCWLTEEALQLALVTEGVQA